MSLLFARVDPDRGEIFADTAIGVADNQMLAAMSAAALVTHDPHAAVRGPSGVPKIVGYGPKVFPSPLLRVIFGFIGYFSSGLRLMSNAVERVTGLTSEKTFDEVLALSADQREAELAKLEQRRPELIEALAGMAESPFDGIQRLVPSVWQELGTPHNSRPLVLVVLGWSAAQKRVAGFVAASGQGMQPEPFLRGLLMSPLPFDGDDDEAQIRAMWEPAANGVRVEEFFRLCALNCARASREGHLGACAIGGRLTACGVTEIGAETHDLGEL